MEIPTFSIFSALSELVVTAVVFYTILDNLRGNKLKWPLLGVVLAFELCVNIVYMVGKAGEVDSKGEHGPAMIAFFAGHGLLSLAMFIGLICLFLVAVIDLKEDKPTWFQRHRMGTYLFLALWMVSLASGEAIFFIIYGPALFS